jgi:hypothetical protein
MAAFTEQSPEKEREMPDIILRHAGCMCYGGLKTATKSIGRCQASLLTFAAGHRDSSLDMI